MNEVLHFSLLCALIISSSRNAQTSRATTIPAMRVGLKVCSHTVKLNMKTSLTGRKLQVPKSQSRQVLGGGINDLWVELVEEGGKSPSSGASVRQLVVAPWEASQGARWVRCPLVGGLDYGFW